MAERTFKTPGVRTFEIDQSGPEPIVLQGVPAGIIGTSQEGPAFVPITVPNFSEFESKFGFADGTQFGPLAAQQWLANRSALTYTRVLGVGDGKQRDSSTGQVARAGFIAGEQLPQANGLLGNNTFANTGQGSTNLLAGAPGRAYFLGCYMSESAGSTIFQDAGIQGLQQQQHVSSSVSILRGVILAASGVTLRLSCSRDGTDNDPLSTSDSGADIGFLTGTVNYAQGSPKFTMLQVGFNSQALTQRAITASLDPSDKDYFASVFNNTHGCLLMSIRAECFYN